MKTGFHLTSEISIKNSQNREPKKFPHRKVNNYQTNSVFFTNVTLHLLHTGLSKFTKFWASFISLKSLSQSSLESTTFLELTGLKISETDITCSPHAFSYLRKALDI